MMRLLQALLLPVLAQAAIEFKLNERFYLPAGDQDGTTSGEPDL